MKKTLVILLMIIASMASLFAASIDVKGYAIYQPEDGNIYLDRDSFVAYAGNALTKAKHVKFISATDFNNLSGNFKDGGWADAPVDPTKHCLRMLYLNSGSDNYVYYVSYDNNATFVFPSDSHDMFGGFSIMEDIIFPKHIDTSNVASMSGMFKNVKQLIDLDMSGWDLSGVTDMSDMLSGCSGLKSVAFPTGANAIGYDNTSAGLDMSGMFQNCTSLETISLADVPIDGNTDMTNTFKGCTNLKEVVVNSDYNPEDPPKGGTTIFEGSGLPNAGKSTGTNGIDNGGNFTFAEIKDDAAKFFASLILDGTLNVYFDVTFTGFTPNTASFTYPDYTSNKTGLITDTFDAARLKSVERNGDYRFPANIAAAQLTQTLGIEITSRGGKSFTPSTSNITPKYIVNEVIKANSGDAKLVALCNSLLTYGSFAQLYFGVDTGNLADPDAKVTAPSVAGLPSATYKYDGVAISGPENIASTTANPDGLNAEFLGNSLVCYSSMTTRHSFDVGEGKSLKNDFNVSVVGSDGTDYVQAGRVQINPTSLPGREYIQIDGFSADKLGDTYTVTVTNKATGHSFSITYSPLCYIKGVLSGIAPTDPDKAASFAKLKNLVASLYRFYEKAQAYF